MPRTNIGRNGALPCLSVEVNSVVADVSGNHDIYRSRVNRHGHFGPLQPVQELNTAFDDRMPNVRSDGLEIMFSSNRPIDAHGVSAFGNFDVYVSRRSSTKKPSSAPINLGPNVNTADSETRSSLSWDGRRLYFGRDSEIYSSSRQRVKANQ